MATFGELGIPFPLFDGSVEGSEYAGLGTCSICTKGRQHGFVLGAGCALMVPCPACQTVSGLHARSRKDMLCRQCRSVIPFPEIIADKILSCYSCLRATGPARE